MYAGTAALQGGSKVRAFVRLTINFSVLFNFSKQENLRGPGIEFSGQTLPENQIKKLGFQSPWLSNITVIV